MKLQPWLSDRTRAARREYRKAEHRWKKDKLQVSFQILKDCLQHYQNVVKEAKREYLWDIIVSNCHNSQVLFRTFDSVLNSPQSTSLEASPELCDNILQFFLYKVVTTYTLTPTPASNPCDPAPCQAVFDKFAPVTLSILEDVVCNIKPSGSPCDAVPPHFFKIFSCTGISVLATINSSLSSWAIQIKLNLI